MTKYELNHKAGQIGLRYMNLHNYSSFSFDITDSEIIFTFTYLDKVDCFSLNKNKLFEANPSYHFVKI